MNHVDKPLESLRAAVERKETVTRAVCDGLVRVVTTRRMRAAGKPNAK